jgi:hypothetical protein
MAALMHAHYYLQKFMFDVFFSETLTWQQQQHNVYFLLPQEWDVILGNDDDHLLCT